jgi:quercetin dioxygenase-like cupin family protein
VIATPPEFIDLTPEMKKRLDRFAEAHKDDPLGGVGGRVLIEDDEVRIWELVLEPGEASALHRHDHDYVLIILEGDYVAGVTLPGDPIGSFVGKVPAAGNTVRVPKGGVEWAYNVGDKTYREFIVELKKS